MSPLPKHQASIRQFRLKATGVRSVGRNGDTFVLQAFRRSSVGYSIFTWQTAGCPAWILGSSALRYIANCTTKVHTKPVCVKRIMIYMRDVNRWRGPSGVHWRPTRKSKLTYQETWRLSSGVEWLVCTSRPRHCLRCLCQSPFYPIRASQKYMRRTYTLVNCPESIEFRQLLSAFEAPTGCVYPPFALYSQFSLLRKAGGTSTLQVESNC
ncbi:hypothetical protein MPH_08456 [Macrophomina phaseolina MS6]|uniref:Uncharacterized protein n=1 Tax=Macrophomina phaseolina (strain MS6) TaxID=1126212 RepID=K2SBY1_MACPH|nr:hypothetical protein MPH_08456 [Macrophomina phaseolina MS6]